MNLADICNMVSYMETFAPYLIKDLFSIFLSCVEGEKYFIHYGEFATNEKDFLEQNGFIIKDILVENRDSDTPQHIISWDRIGDERYKKEVTELIGYKPYYIILEEQKKEKV